MKSESYKKIKINNWILDISSGELENAAQASSSVPKSRRFDPLSTQLLILLAQHHNQLVSKDMITNQLWPDTIVTDDALARCVSRVRKLLDDDAKQPEFIETLPKRGYRLIAEQVRWISEPPADTSPPLHSRSSSRWSIALFVLGIFVIGLFFTVYRTPSSPVNDVIAQADTYYHQISRHHNEMAVELYQKALALDPNSIEAASGLANAFVQRAIRMPTHEDTQSWQALSLSSALANGKLNSNEAQLQLTQAQQLASRAVSLDSSNARARKAMGFVMSAQNQLDSAIEHYHTALKLNPLAWDVLINMGELYAYRDEPNQAIIYFKRALDAVNQSETAKNSEGKAWRASIGTIIGDEYAQLGNTNEAEIWYRHVLAFAPFDKSATLGLASLLRQANKEGEYQRLCDQYQDRIGEVLCRPYTISEPGL